VYRLGKSHGEAGAAVRTDGKHLWVEGRPWRARGVTYGSFRPRLDGELFPDTFQVKADFAAISELGLNTVRTYSMPPEDILDLADEYGLKLLVGLHYHDWRLADGTGRRTNRKVLQAGRAAVHRALERCAERDSILAISVGNEVPGDVVRVHGIGAVEEVLSELVAEVHAGDPCVLATYANFPTTEYLQVEGQDLACFNVFLENPEAFRSYVKRLQVVSGEVPLLLTELGFASEIHGEETQAEAIEWQLRIADECGAAGACVYAWTDEWAVADEPVDGWGFGITDAERIHKPATEIVSKWARSDLGSLREKWPRISAVVCAYNAMTTIADCLASLERSDYPNLEIIVCDDGSTDGTVHVAKGFFKCKVMELPHAGLSTARNAGIEAASGEIVAFIDADAACHPEWPYHLALSLEGEEVGGTGGPNLPSPQAGFVERAVAASPGNPIEVLTSDDRAEHVPGCNMAFKKDALGAVHWFDPVYTAAGDDVDVCWKLIEKGYSIGFSPAAQVRHHRRDSVRGYLKQQRGYGKAERMLWTRHPHRFNRLGQASWSGFIYGGPRLLAKYLRPVVYHGFMGRAPYQGVVRRRSEMLLGWSQALVPAAGLIAGASALAGIAWTPFLVMTALALMFVVGFAASVAIAARPSPTETHKLGHRLLVGALHVIQPLVRAWARLRNRAGGAQPPPTPAWRGDRLQWLLELRRQLVARRCAIRWGTATAAWDFKASFGPFVSYKVTTAVVWAWVPQHSARLAIRPAFLATAALGGLLLSWISTAGIVVLSGVAFLAVAEAIALRRILKKSIAATSVSDEKSPAAPAPTVEKAIADA
jgi:O-antigen biosynthesis protein